MTLCSTHCTIRYTVRFVQYASYSTLVPWYSTVRWCLSVLLRSPGVASTSSASASTVKCMVLLSSSAADAGTCNARAARNTRLHNFDTAYSIPDIDRYTVPGRYTFLDQMVVGVPGNGTGDDGHKGGVPGPGLTFDETQAHMSLWVMAASPLLTCNDVRNMSAEIKEILTNAEVLAVHKDPLAKMAVRVDVGGGIEESHSTAPCASEYSVYNKGLADGSSAVMVLNRGEINLTLVVNAEDVGDSMHAHYSVRDLWQHKNLTMTTVATSRQRRGRYAAADAATSAGVQLTVPAHGVRMLRMWPTQPPPPPPPPPPHPPCPAGFEANGQAGYWKNLELRPTVLTVDGCGAACNSVGGCVAFELYLAPPPSANNCYIFLAHLQDPFTPNAQSVTCLAEKDRY